jgi:hypothetical protein
MLLSEHLISIVIEQALERMDYKNFRPSHFSGNPLGTPPFPEELSFFPLINFPTSMLTLPCPQKFILLFHETRI